jgi:hypothetical protein
MMFILYKYHKLVIAYSRKMDIVYYSNYCKHSQKLLQYLAKHGLTTKVNCICIDKRKRDPNTNQTYIYLEKGGAVLLPPNVHCVPALLLVNEKYRVLVGEDIYKQFSPKIATQNAIATNNNGEPESYVLSSSQNGMSIQSEQYTFYNMTPDELSAKGRGGMRQMYNYVSAFHDNMSIQTPPETYRPNKVSSESVEALEQMRNSEMNPANGANPAIPAIPTNTMSMPPPPMNMNGGSAGVPENRFISNGGAPSQPPYYGQPAYPPPNTNMNNAYGNAPSATPSYPSYSPTITSGNSQQSYRHI